jgi:hypothetical protein
MARNLSPPPFLQFFQNGVPLAGGLLYTYEDGTTTPLETFASASGEDNNPNPIELDSEGRCVAFLTEGATYTFELHDAADALIESWDGIEAWSLEGVAQAVQDALEDLISPFMLTMLDDESAEEARGTLGIAYPYDTIVAVSDESTAITTGLAKRTFRFERAFSLTAIHANLNTVSSSGVVQIDVNRNGTTLFTTELTIDESEKTSRTAVTPPVLATSPTAIAAGDEITVDIVAAGTGAKGLKLNFLGTAA